MISPNTHIIAANIISSYEEELMASLPDLYPNDGERQIVENILIPQFRSLVDQTLAAFPAKIKQKPGQNLSPAQISMLCTEIDKQLEEHEELLDTEGLLKPILEEIRKIRAKIKIELEADFKNHFKEILAAKGIVDRAGLILKGPIWFMHENFLPYGKGIMFAKAILNKTNPHITIEILHEIADILGFPKIEQHNQLAVCKKLLAEKGITDRETLITKGPIWFVKEDFSPYGKGKAFASAILGRMLKAEFITIQLLEEVADILAFPHIDKFEKYRTMLKEKGITDRHSLFQKSTKWFELQDFAPYGKGKAFASAVLGRAIRYNMTKEIFEELVQKLQLPAMSAETIAALKVMLLNKGIFDRAGLIAKGSVWFTHEDFPPYGKGVAFAAAILSRRVKVVNIEILHELADILRFPEIEIQDQLEAYKRLLAEKGVLTQEALIKKGVAWFVKEKFGVTQDGGVAVANKILNRIGAKSVSLQDLYAISKKLDLELQNKADKAIEFKKVLAEHGVTREQLTSRGYVLKFTNTDFPPYGKGLAFAAAILGRPIRHVDSKILKEVADKLFS